MEGGGGSRKNVRSGVIVFWVTLRIRALDPSDLGSEERSGQGCVLTGFQLLSGEGGEGVVERLWQQHREEVMAVKTGLVSGDSPVGQSLPLL